MNKKQIMDIRRAIVNAALPDVVFDGWSWAGVQRAAQKAGHESAIAGAVFPGGLEEVLGEFSTLADEGMRTSLSAIDPQALRVRDRIRTAVIARLEFLRPHKEAVRASLGVLARPSRKSQSMKMVWRTADCIWDWAGDESTDYNYYTKRGLLSAILVSTTLVWLDDESADMQITKNFLDRRIDNALSIGKVFGKIKRVK